MILKHQPIWTVDIAGSLAMILLSFLCLNLSFKLRRRDPANIIWTYLLWVCLALAVFAVSRSLGHILKQFLLLSGHIDMWIKLAPLSGAVNSFTFMVVGSVTLFFERSWAIYQQMAKDKQALAEAHKNVIYLNQNLESLIDERTRALAVSEAKYRQIFEVSKDMILVSTWQGLIININPAGKKMLGISEENGFIKGHFFQEFLVRRSDWTKITDRIHKFEFIGSEEVQLRLSDSRNLRVLVSGSLVRGGENQEDSLHFWIKDIEQRHLMMEQIAQADKLASIGELSAGIAHEINNPLGVILGYTQLLIRGSSKDSNDYNDLKTIEKHTRHCKGIVEDLLNFARTSKPKKTLVNIHHVIDAVLNFIRYQGDLDRIRITQDFDDSIPSLLIDEKKVKQVLINLIMNARHAVGKSGAIGIHTENLKDSKQVAIHISDTGHGIQPQHLAQIFDPFFTTKPTGEGTGLGLSVSYGIIKNHGGHINVSSIPGQGATFTITLPANGADE